MNQQRLEYIHGHSAVEQQRLFRQAQTLEPFLHQHVALHQAVSVLEIGCGVGAQLKLLVERNPQARFVGIDLSAGNVARARAYLREHVESGRVTLLQGDAVDLPFPEASFDAVVIFFVLEHVQDPPRVLSQARRVLSVGGQVYCTEVVNSNLLAWPESKVISSYWRTFNQYQRDAGGDPDIGIKLGGLFHRAGFTEIELLEASVLMDGRTESPAQRRDLVDNWVAVFLSLAPALVEKGLVEKSIEAALKAEFAKYLHDPDSVFLYTAKQLKGRR